MSPRQSRQAEELAHVRRGIAHLVRMEVTTAIGEIESVRRCFAVAAPALSATALRTGLALLAHYYPLNWNTVSLRKLTRATGRKGIWNRAASVGPLEQLNIIQTRRGDRWQPNAYRFSYPRNWDWSEIVRRGGSAPTKQQPRLDKDAWLLLHKRFRPKKRIPQPNPHPSTETRSSADLLLEDDHRKATENP